jgi:hypothetical protein
MVLEVRRNNDELSWMLKSWYFTQYEQKPSSRNDDDDDLCHETLLSHWKESKAIECMGSINKLFNRSSPSVAEVYLLVGTHRRCEMWWSHYTENSRATEFCVNDRARKQICFSYLQTQKRAARDEKFPPVALAVPIRLSVNWKLNSSKLRENRKIFIHL